VCDWRRLQQLVSDALKYYVLTMLTHRCNPCMGGALFADALCRTASHHGNSSNHCDVQVLSRKLGHGWAARTMRTHTGLLPAVGRP